MANLPQEAVAQVLAIREKAITSEKNVAFMSGMMQCTSSVKKYQHCKPVAKAVIEWMIAHATPEELAEACFDKMRHGNLIDSMVVHAVIDKILATKEGCGFVNGFAAKHRECTPWFECGSAHKIGLMMEGIAAFQARGGDKFINLDLGSLFPNFGELYRHDN